jgi:hypothetical protein
MAATKEWCGRWRCEGGPNVNAEELQRLEATLAQYQQRIDNQAASIDRMLKHIQFHHDAQGYTNADHCPVISGKVKLEDKA